MNADRKETVDSYYHMLNETDRGRRTVRTGHFNHNRREMMSFFCDVYQTAKELGLDTPLMDRINQGIGGCAN